MYANKKQGCQTVEPSFCEDKINGNLKRAATKTKKENCY